MSRTEHRIFVLDIANQPALAFEADSAFAAEALISASWFTEAVEDFCKKRRKIRNGTFPTRPRLATDVEASLYRERADEFAELTDHFLIAHISER